MNRGLRVTIVSGIMAAVMAGVTYAATRPIPENEPQTVVQNGTGTALPGDAKALEQALQAAGPVKYKVLVLDSTEGEDRTAYLDRVAEKWGQPAADTLLLVVYPEGNYDIRFYMGAIFRQNGVSVDDMLKLTRERYLPKARLGDAAGGLADMMLAVNHRIGQVPPGPVTVADPFGNGPRRTAVDELKLGKGLLTAYLNQYKAKGPTALDRLTDFRFDDNKLNPVESGENKIVFLVHFDVLPAVAEGSGWMAGNGSQGEGGWIVGKTLFLTAVREGSLWKLTGTATSP